MVLPTLCDMSVRMCVCKMPFPSSSLKSMQCKQRLIRPAQEWSRSQKVIVWVPRVGYDKSSRSGLVNPQGSPNAQHTHFHKNISCSQKDTIKNEEWAWGQQDWGDSCRKLRRAPGYCNALTHLSNCTPTQRFEFYRWNLPSRKCPF